MAGSSWPQDEELLARYLQERDDVRLILVPHEIHEEHLHYIFQLFHGQLIRFTRVTRNNIGQTRVLLLDPMGMLSSVYKYADVAYIGGGFGDGIHNTLEAAVWGIPVLFGVLTTDNLEQAIERAGTKGGNKGADAAKSALETANLLAQI